MTTFNYVNEKIIREQIEAKMEEVRLFCRCHFINFKTFAPYVRLVRELNELN